MKKFFLLFTMLALTIGGFSSCQKKGKPGELCDPEEICEPEEEEVFFYYCFDEKIFLKQRKDLIYIKFPQDVDTEHLRTLINSDASLLPTSYVYLDKSPLRYAVLESKDGKQIPVATIDSFKKREEVVSVSYMYYIQGGWQLLAVTDDFSVKLKETTTYEQLNKLAEQYHCTIGEENRYVKNQFMMYVPKTSRLDAMQIANLFQETGLFEFAAPNMIVFNLK